MRWLGAALVALSVLIVTAAGAEARADKLTSTPYGVVDFGDQIAYRVTGAKCRTARVAVDAYVGTARRQVAGPRSLPRSQPGRGCAGRATVPTWRRVSAAGWRPGEAISLALRSGRQLVPLRLMRINVAQQAPAAGSPTLVPAGDPQTGPGDDALAMKSGDAVGLGRVDLHQVDSIAVRVCITGVANPVLPGAGGGNVPTRIEPPVFMSLRENSATGPAIVGPIDVANDETNPFRFETLGFPGCYRLVVLPLTQAPDQDAPPLFLRVDSALPGVLKVNSVDIDGTGAAAGQAPLPAPKGMRTIFNGSSFHGFTETGCTLAGGAAVNQRTDANPADITPCSLTYDTPVTNMILHLQVRTENFFDNAAIMLGSQEIQLREAGEYLPGGYVGSLAAQFEKLDPYPAWNEVEIAQLGARTVVSVNGRTVTDVIDPNGAPAPYKLEFETQPFYSGHLGWVGYGDETGGLLDLGLGLTLPSGWGAYQFRNIQLLRCPSATAPVCAAVANARRGEVPVPAGAPA